MGATQEQPAGKTIYQSLSGLLLLGVWLLAAEDVLLDGLLSSSLSNSFGFHPASFAAFTAAFLLATLRRGLLGVWDDQRSVALGSHIFTVVIGLLALGRGFQLSTGLPFTGLDTLLGERGSPSYSSFPTLFMLWLLHVTDAYWPKSKKGPMVWANYALFSLILFLTLHQISDTIGLRFDHPTKYIKGLSLLSSCLLISFMAFLLTEAPATALVFDRRTPKSNAASAGTLLVILAILFLLEHCMPYPGLALSLAALMLAGLPVLVATFRPREIDARIKRGELTEDEDTNEEDLSAYGLHTKLAGAPSGAKPKGLLGRSVYWATFEATDWQRLAIQGFWTFILANCAILLSRQAGDIIASIWWANAYLAYCLLLHPRDQWFKTLLTFYGAVMVANVLADNDPVASTILTSLNTLEGAVIGVAASAILQVEVSGRYITAPRLSMGRLLMGTASILIISLFFGLLAGALLTDLFGGSLVGGSLGLNVYAWSSGSIMGTFVMAMLGLGRLMEFHWGYKSLGRNPAIYPYLAVSYLLLVSGLYGLLPPPASIAVPHMLFILLSLPLVFLPSLLQAANLFSIVSTVYFYFTTARWTVEDIPFHFLFLIPLVSSAITLVFIWKYLFAHTLEDEQRALTLAPNAFLTFDAQGHVLRISKNAEKWFERSPEQLIGKRLVTLFDNSEELQAAARERFSQGATTAFTTITRRTKADGSVLHLEASVQANTDPRLPYAFVVSLRDVTREVELEAEKKALIDRSTSHLLVQDEQCNTLQCSDAWVEFSGYSREETLAKDFHEFLHPDDFKQARREREALLTGFVPDANDTTSYRLITKAGDEKTVRLRSLQQIEEGKPRILLTILDLTELEQKKLELEQASKQSLAYLKASGGNFTIQDEAFQILYASDEAKEVFGEKGKKDHPSVATDIWPDTDEAYWEAHRAEIRALETGQIWNSPDYERVKGADGVERIVTRSRHWFDNPTGAGRLLYSESKDWTELLAERSLNEQLLDKSPAIILTEGRKYKLLSCSKGWIERLGYSRAETVGADMVSFLIPEQVEHFNKVRQRFLDGVYTKGEWEPAFLSKSGEKVFTRMNVRVDESVSEWRLIHTISDVTEIEIQRQALQRALQNSEALLAAGTSAYTVVDENFDHVLISEQAMKLFGYLDSKEAVPYLKMYKNLTEKQRQAQLQELRELETGKILQFPETDEMHTRDGRVIRIRRSSRWFPNPVADGRLLWTNLDDVTEIEEQRRYTETILNRSAAITIIQDQDGKILSCSDAWSNQLGYSRGETLGRNLVDFMPPEEADKNRIDREKIKRPIAKSAVKKIEIQLRRKSGKLRTMELQSVFETINGSWHNIITLVDITEIKAAQEKLTLLVEHDALTGLLSRHGLNSRFVEQQRAHDAALFILDVDHFKSVNDSYGHDTGDALLKAYADTLTRLTEDAGCAIRLGGEEFAVIRPWSGWEQAYTFAETLRSALAKTKIEVNGRHIQRTASIGFAALLKDGDMAQAMKLADMMQKEAKETGRNKVIGADPEMLAQLEARGAFITNEDVQEALERGELCYYVHPIWNTQDKAIEGFEALIRWQKPDGTMVMPNQFVDVLSVIIREPHFHALKMKLGQDVLAALAAFPDAYISFNYKLEQLAYEGAAQEIVTELNACKDHPGRQLVVEISESAIHERVDSTVLLSELEALKGFGYRIALDDFGVESSNIKRLQDYPIDIVKLDKSLIAGLEHKAKQRSTITALTIMLHNLNLHIVAEGVETIRQAKTLNVYKLFSQQGFLHARPMPPEDIASNLEFIGADLTQPEPMTQVELM